MSERPLWIQFVGEPARAAELPRQGVLSIGSSSGQADFVVDGQGVADVHCVIGRAVGGGWALKDLGSEYGTMRNGKRVKSARLREGDKIVLGSRRLEVVDRSRQEASIEPEQPVRKREPGNQVGAARSAESSAGTPPRIAGFRIERPLGRGGMGQVWLAVQESLDRRVALKILSPRLARDEDFRRRFLAEARAAAALHHANVVTVFDVGEDGGHHYLAMEYMARGNLETRVARTGALPWAEVVGILRDAARGLVFAEQKGIVHRDIKPANLMQNEVGETKIADLGLATQLEAEAETGSDGKIFGTPHFIAPEQARGERVDARSDLYSLGATLYRLLSGRTPFEGETTRDILRGHFTEEPVPLDERVSDLPPDLVVLVHRLLAKDPGDRYPSAAVLLAQVEALGAQAPLAGTGAPPGRGLRLGVGAAVLALAALVILRALGGDDEEPGPPIDVGSTTRSDPEPGSADPPEPLAGVDSTDPGDSGDSGGGGPEPGDPGADPLEDDRALQLFELQAEIAYRDLVPDLSDEARARALRALADEFAGSTVATRAREEAEALESAAAAAIRAERDRDRALDDALLALRSAAGLDGDDPMAPGAALTALLATELAGDAASVPGVEEGRLELVREIGRSGLAAADAGLARADALEEGGDFDGSAALLTALAADLELPEVPEPLRTAEIVELGVNARAVRARLSSIEDRRAVHAWRTAGQDARRLADALGGAAGFESAVAAFEFTAARARLDDAGVSSPGAIELCDAWRADLAAADRAARALVGAFAADGWRRRALPDPRSGRGGTVNVIGADGDGITVDESGGPVRIAWSVLASQPAVLHHLFHERLARDWTREEQADVAALLRLSAVLGAVQAVEEMLVPARDAHFTPAEADEVGAGFDAARPWSERTGDADAVRRLDREERAAELLTVALVEVEAGRWSAAAARVEELLAEHSDTLVVRLLSDGAGLMGEPPEAVEAAAANGSEGQGAEDPIDPDDPDQTGGSGSTGKGATAEEPDTDDESGAPGRLGGRRRRDADDGDRAEREVGSGG